MTDSSSPQTSPSWAVAPAIDDDAIPMLTDVVVVTTEPSGNGASRVPEDYWTLIATKVEIGVTERLMSHTNPLLEGAINDLLPPLLARAAAQLTSDLRDGIGHLVRDLVARAVADELAHLRAQHPHPPHSPAP